MVVVVRLMNLLDDRYFGGGKIVVDEFIKKIELSKDQRLSGVVNLTWSKSHLDQIGSRSMSRWFVSVLVPDRSTITARPPSRDRAFA
jgi:hypothetical protein